MAKILTREQLDQTIKDYLSRLRGKIKIDKVILFGSYAKGTATELSDVDLLIISKDLSPDEPKCKNGFYLDNLVGDFNPRLEVMAINPQKLNNSIEKGFFKEILATGKEIAF